MVNDLPNIVLVVFDTARWDRFGCYGYDRSTTPTVDELARSGLVVERMIASGPWTPPSHGSLFTGLYPTQHGSQWQTGPAMRDSVEVTMAEWLAALGYTTICATNNGLIDFRGRLARGFQRYAYRMDLEHGLSRKIRRAKRVLLGAESGGVIINGWIREQLKEVQRPVFLFVNYRECHWSYAPPPSALRQIGGGTYGPLEALRYRAEVAAKRGPWEAIAKATHRDLRAYSDYYDGELATADRHLARLLDILKATGHLKSPTLVIVTSDHGEHIGEHGLADHHASLDDHLIRVPFVAWGPGLVRAERRSGLYEMVDVFPSVASLLDLAPPTAYLRDRRTDLFRRAQPREGSGYAFSEWRSWTPRQLERLAKRNPSFGFKPLAKDLVAVLTDQAKLVRASSGEEWLFDLGQDPAEERAVSSPSSSVAVDLGRALDAAVESWAPWDSTRTNLSAQETAEIERRLAELGYI